MITQEINHWTPPAGKKEKSKFVVGTSEHRQWIFYNNLVKAEETGRYILGNKFTAKGRKGTGQIINIVSNFDEVEWEGLKVKFLELWFSHEDFLGFYHPSDLKEVQ